MAVEREEIAIVGSGCRFPGGSTSPDKLWALLSEPRLVASEVPSLKGYYHKDAQYHGHANVREAYLLEGEGVHRRFDAAFFGISAAEAKNLDPQTRLLLEVVYEALENGGQVVDRLRGSDTAVYAGQMVNDYELLMYRDHENYGKYHATGASRAMLSNRVSYFFDWHGPSMTIDTACSSSLVALHHAVQQLRSGHSRVAIVAGSNLIYDAGTFIAETNLQMLSPGGRSRMWDADADGYARGEGVAAIVLKTRQAAEADGDHIECIIRETAVNQDGRTRGQTMPSASAQAQLIKDCYARAGLELRNPMHRPQYFEAHGTGTPAGDPIEAEAVSTALFPDGQGGNGTPEPLYVGSCKAVIGHTEGTAGIAGILKASLALQHASIPPNLHFQRLNPDIIPFYDNLCIPTGMQKPWPSMAWEGPRRASVNSFGFGGTNAHAILESYSPRTGLIQSDRPTLPPCIPFVFSAASESSLKRYLESFCDYLSRGDTQHSLDDIASSLSSRRTRLPVAVAIGASHPDELRAKIQQKLEASRNDPDQRVGVRPTCRDAARSGTKPRILGVFTGQGAQWAQMGLELVTTFQAAKSSIERLQKQLDRLPVGDRPAWSLLQELQKDASSSRVMSAAVSQPLCTAIQIMQVDLLRAAGIEFSAVVGHSSGEIAAAYAAGLLSAEDAISIAYYRGLQSGSSQGAQKGAMMAVGTSAEDAEDLLGFPEFAGRACIAAVNSKQSVTLSGDEDALRELEVVFCDEEKFTRFLKVDRAYHSFHMRASSAAYLDSLEALGVGLGHGNQTRWFSSVSGSETGGNELLKGLYWERNMVQPVLFMQAIDKACIAMKQLDLVIELGPHPALKGPALETIQDRLSCTIPYTGLFHRGNSSIVSLADGIGYIWMHLGEGGVNLQSYAEFVSGGFSSTPVKGLPTYAWDHQNEYWHESRHARAVRLRQDPVNELLGHLTPDSTEHDMRWRHVLRLSEIPWLSGHRLQNGIIFPAAGYVMSVLEAVQILCKKSPVKTIELLDLDIVSALMFEHENSSMEIILSLANISRRNERVIETEFKYHAAPADGFDDLKLKASGHVRVHLGDFDDTALPTRQPKMSNMLPVLRDRFYDSIAEIGYQYSGPFKALDGIERKLGAATGLISTLEPTSLVMHPATLDAAFHSTFLTYASPGDGALNSMHVPRRIRRLVVNPNLCTKGNQGTCAFEATHTFALPHANLTCDINIYPGSLDYAMVQIEALECVPFSPKTANDDQSPFYQLTWGVANPNVEMAVEHNTSPAASNEAQVSTILERTAAHYLRMLAQQIPSNHPARSNERYKTLFQCALLSTAGHMPQWEQDTPEILAETHTPFLASDQLKRLSLLGDNLVAIVKGDQSALEVARQCTISDQSETRFGERTFTAYLARILQQIVHRYPRMHIFELPSGTCPPTQTILDEIGSKFSSYTVTTHLPPVTPSDSEMTSANDGRLVSKHLDLSRSLKEQGFLDYSYDLVVAPSSLHVTSDLNDALRKVRRLLKPGGHLVMMSALPQVGSFFGALSATFPEFWGGDAKNSPTVPPGLEDWHVLLRANGFSGIDTSSGDANGAILFSVFASQAVDERIAFLRDPLSLAFPSSERPVQDLVVLGGNSSTTRLLVDQISAVLEPVCGRLQTAGSFDDFVDLKITPGTTILNLQDLDGSIFEDLNDKAWDVVKRLALHTGTLIWVTRERRAANPRANMAVGLLRAAARENPALDYALLDIGNASDSDHRIIAETLLRHKAASRWCHQDDLQFSAENELVVDKAGRLLVPRLMPNQEMNDRYNSNGREVRTSVRADTHELSLSMRGDKWDVSSIPPSTNPHDGSLRLRTTHSLISPVRVAEFGSMYVVIGRDETTSRDVVALSSNNASVVHVHPKLSVSVNKHRGSEDRLLWLASNYLLASVILRGLSEGDKALVHGWKRESAWILAERARALGVEAKFTSTDACATETDSLQRIVLHPHASASALDRLAQDDFSVFIDMTNDAENGSLGSKIASSLSTYCRKENYAALFAKHAYNPRSSHLEGIHARLDEAVRWASVVMRESPKAPWSQGPIPTMTLGSISGIDTFLEPLTVVEWASASAVSARACPVDSLVSFPGNRTYWLVGLTGGVGLSLCEWMVQRGARSFVISSRSPNIEAAWLDEMRRKGVVIKVSKCDVTSESQVKALYQEISCTMPPIAGVAQGVMVLEDKSLQDMTLEQLLAVTKPKVEGSIYLDRLFSENTLDFFIFFSSVSTVVGNHGQANYAAANAFMASLAEQRKARGLAASVIDIGPIAGIGYISRSFDDGVLDRMTMRTSGWAKTSERDFHQLFGEAVLAGRPGSTGPVEIGSGLRRVRQGEDDQPVWHSWPRMSHLISGGEGPMDPAEDGAEAKIPIKDRLLKATDAEIYNIIWNAFASQIGSHFQLDTRDASKEELASMRLDQMGIDSLMAMEIRGWFMKTLEVNIPVLKILNGSSIGELVTIATEAIQERRAEPVDEGSEASATSQELADSSSTDLDGPGHTDDESVSSKPGSLRSFEQSGRTILKSVPVSFTQARFYPSGIFLEDLVGLNHTAWGKITGAIDPERLRQAVLAVGQQHEILRTAFFDQDGQQTQHILKTSTLRLEEHRIEDEAQVERLAMSIQKGHVYDVARGETIRLILMSRSGGAGDYLVIGVHPLIMDATGIQVFLRWLAFHYTDPHSQPLVKQFATASEQRRAAYAAGKYIPELEYWRREFPSPPPALPLLTLSKVAERPVLRAYENITADCRIGTDTKVRIAEICRAHRTTPFHFYLAALRALLLRYTVGGEDVTTAVAENGRGRDADEMEVIGPLYNLVLVRIVADLSTKFEHLLEVARNKTYAGLANGNMPFIKVVEELGLQRNAKHTPFFQVFADYRTGQKETVAFGEENELSFMGFDLNVPYDVYLDTVDVPDGDCAHCLFLRKDLFDQSAADRLASSYKRLIEAFAAEPELSVGAVALSAPGEVEGYGI